MVRGFYDLLPNQNFDVGNYLQNIFKKIEKSTDVLKPNKYAEKLMWKV